MPVHGCKHQMDNYYAERGYRRHTVRKQAAERCVAQQCRPCWCGYQVGRRSHETSTTTPLRHEIGSGHLDSNFNDCTAINIQRWSGYGSLGSTSHLKIALLHFLALGRLLWAMLGAYWWEKWILIVWFGRYFLSTLRWTNNNELHYDCFDDENKIMRYVRLHIYYVCIIMFVQLLHFSFSTPSN